MADQQKPPASPSSLPVQFQLPGRKARRSIWEAKEENI